MIQLVETIAKDIVNVKLLMKEIDDYVNDEIMKGTIRQEELQEETNNMNSDSGEISESETECSDKNNENEVVLEEQPGEINGIPVVEDVESSDDEEEMNNNGPHIGDLNSIGEISDTTSNNDIDMINDSESDEEVPRKMSEDKIMDPLKYDVDGPTDIVDRQRFEEACQQARGMDREEKEEESPKPKAKTREQPKRNVRTREKYRYESQK